MSEWFHIGEVCLLVGSPENCFTSESAKYFGTEVTITGFGSRFSYLAHHEYQFVTYDGEPGSCTKEHLRKKPPKPNDAEPRTDFTPADDEFREDLTRRLKRAKEHA